MYEEFHLPATQEALQDHARLPVVAIFHDTALTMSSKIVYLILAANADATGACTMSAQELAFHTCLSTATITKNIRELAAIKAITYEKVRGYGNVYYYTVSIVHPWWALFTQCACSPHPANANANAHTGG
jgi:hypothetical protein